MYLVDVHLSYFSVRPTPVQSLLAHAFNLDIFEKKNSYDLQSTYIGARHMIVYDASQRAHNSV